MAKSDDIDLAGLFALWWRAKWTIVITGVSAAAVAAVVTLMIADVFRTQTVLAPSSDISNALPVSLAAQVSSIAGLALGTPTSDPVQVAIATLQSRRFLVSFVRQHELVVPLIAGGGWDHERRQWEINDRIYDVESHSWVREATAWQPSQPTDEEIFEIMDENLDVSLDRATGLVTMTFKSRSPVAARDWAAMMIDDLNAELRARAIEEATSSIAFLNAEIGKTEIATMRESLYRLVEDQMKKRVLAEVRKNYAVSLIDPPMLPEEKIFPIRWLICLGAALLGGILAAIALVVQDAIRRTSTSS
jgi:uncharacterized protein involved in exopolysaccharide biosynthesis